MTVRIDSTGGRDHRQIIARDVGVAAEGPMPEMIIDSFAGGGGASTGIELALQALGFEDPSVDIAINHNGPALAMHAANHPGTLHMESDIWTVDPLATTAGRPVGLLWASPDCRHFSRAKGSTPVSKKVRGLAWSIGHWAEQVHPRIIILENVEEFMTWGPTMIGPKGDDIPDPQRSGETFREWLARFKKAGYRVEWRVLRACDYGAPTIRKRLYIIMRRDGEPIVWPKPTHGAPTSPGVRAGKLKPWMTAAEIIDWSLPCPSILVTKEEARVYTKATRRQIVRPLAPNTLTRIAKGFRRYVLECEQPVFMTSDYSESGGRNDRAAPGCEPAPPCDPSLVSFFKGLSCRSVSEPHADPHRSASEPHADSEQPCGKTGSPKSSRVSRG